jgi:hypothetical protein
MATITFANENAHGIFHSMCEGMWEVARDDHVSAIGDEGPRARLLGAVMDATPGAEGLQYPATFALPYDVVETARDVLENIEDNREGYQLHDDDAAADPDDRDYIIAGEIVIA